MPSVRAARSAVCSFLHFQSDPRCRRAAQSRRSRPGGAFQPVTVLGTVVIHRSIIYVGFRFSLEWLKLESQGGHSVWHGADVLFLYLICKRCEKDLLLERITFLMVMVKGWVQDVSFYNTHFFGRVVLGLPWGSRS